MVIFDRNITQNTSFHNIFDRKMDFLKNKPIFPFVKNGEKYVNF